MSEGLGVSAVLDIVGEHLSDVCAGAALVSECCVVAKRGQDRVERVCLDTLVSDEIQFFWVAYHSMHKLK